MKKATSNDTKRGVPAREIDDYLAALPEDKRVTLEKLRKTIQAAAPQAEEVISYRMPAFKYNGKPLAGFAAFKDHCSFFPMSSEVMRAHAAELKGRDITKGGIRFPANQPLPVQLVRMLVKTRIAEIEKSAAQKKRIKK